MKNVVTAEYVQGIVDGRAYFRRFQPDRASLVANVRNLEETMRGFSPGPVKDALRGERDFMRNQIKRLLATG